MTTEYTPMPENIWSGRPDAEDDDYIYQRVKPLHLNTPALNTSALSGYALLGFESDAGVIRNFGNKGASQGPNAFRQAFAKCPVHCTFDLFDAGNVTCIGDDLESAQDTLKTSVEKLLSWNLKPIVIGGGHETAWGHYQGLESHYHQGHVAILNFDAHFDLRPLIAGQRGSSGTSFRQIHTLLNNKQKPFHYYCVGIQPFANTKHLFQYANTHQVHYMLAETIHADAYNLHFIEEIIQTHRHIYVSICLDVFNMAYAPGVSAPQALGIAPTYVLEALKLLRQSNRVVGLDIVELAPKYDREHQTAKLAAALLMTYLQG
jgi:formiminoglutamase